MRTRIRAARLAFAALLAGAAIAWPATGPATAQQPKTLRIAMTAADVPTTNGMPNNGFEGVRFLGYPVFESLVLWDLSRADVLAPIRPGLATSWEQDPDDAKRWRFHLRQGVKFHDETPFNADAVIWNLDRFFKQDSPQFDPTGSAIVRGRVPGLVGYRKLDDNTVEIQTVRPISYFPYLMPYIFMTSPASWEAAGRDYAKLAYSAAGTGPFRLSRFVPRQSAELTRNDNYWDADHRAKVDRVLLLPMPEANTRLAALRSGQVDWIEVPPSDAIPSLKQSGFQVVTNSYPHDWPWIFGVGKPGSPVADVRVRRALNYCIDRDAMGTLLNGTSEPELGFFNRNTPYFGQPHEHYRLDAAHGKALLAEAGFNAQHPLKLKVAISNSGSGQMLPLPMNELMQQMLAENCGVQVEFAVVEWNTLLGALRATPDSPQWLGADALNISLGTSDISQMARYLMGVNATPNGSNAGQWRNAAFDAAMTEAETAKDPAAITAAAARAHAIAVDEAPWLFIVHDLNPRAMSRRVRGFVSAQSWFQDLTRVDLQ